MQNLQLQNKDANCREGVWKLLSYGFKQENLKWNTTSANENEEMLLILKNMSLMILKGNKLEESFSLIMHDIKRIVYDKDSMAFVVQQQNVKRSVRLRFAGGVFYTGDDICTQCVQTLSHYVIADRVNKDDQTGKPDNISLMQYVSEFVKNTKGVSPQKFKELESMYPLEDIVDECILDVNFPDMVVKVRELLEVKLGPSPTTK